MENQPKPNSVEPVDLNTIFDYSGPFDIRIVTQVIALHQDRSITVKRFKDSLDDNCEIYVV